MIGDPLLRMTQPDPTPDQVAEYAREIHSAQWRGLRKDLDKWTPSRKTALFEGEGDSARNNELGQYDGNLFC